MSRLDLCHQNSANNVQWYPEVLHFCPYTPLVLVGLKSDLRNKRSCIDLLKVQGLTPVTEEQGRAVARKMNARYMECSSKEMTGVDEIFRSAIDICVKQKEAEIATRHARENEERRPKTSGADTIMGGAAGIKKKRRCKIL